MPDHDEQDEMHGEETFTQQEAKSPQQDPTLPTVTELAKKHGHYRAVNEATGATPFTAQHLVAGVRHGWAHYAWTHGDEPVRLSDADYLAAIDAAHIGKVHGPANFRPAKKGSV